MGSTGSGSFSAAAPTPASWPKMRHSAMLPPPLYWYGVMPPNSPAE